MEMKATAWTEQQRKPTIGHTSSLCASGGQAGRGARLPWQRALDLEVVEDGVADALHDARSGVVRLVHAVAEAHEAEGVALVLGARERLRDVVLAADALQHLQHRLVRAAVCRAPQGGDARRYACERVRLARACASLQA